MSEPAREARPLTGVRVLDCTSRLAGAYAGKMLRDVGADVIVTGGCPDDAVGRWLQAGKRSIDRADVPMLQEIADILLVDTDDVPARQGSVTVSITDFGRSGPWADRPASHLTLEAESGSLGSRGVPELPPVAVGGQLGEWIAGLYAGAAALAAWRSARSSGTAEYVEVSVFECMLVSLNMHEPLHAALAKSDAFTRWVQVPSVERTKDGWVCFSLVTGQQWQDFCVMIERPELGEDQSLGNMLGRWPRRHEIYAAMEPWLTVRTVEEVVERATAFRLPVAHVTDGPTIAAMEHFRVRQALTTSPHGAYSQPRPPYLFSGFETAPAEPAPQSVTDTAAVVEAWQAGPRRRERSQGAPRRPLAGIRIVDLTAFFAGPSGTGYLAALGADVIKVESVQRPDGIRFAGGQITRDDGWWEWSWVFQGANAGKRGITLDLGRDEGREILHQLLAGADVLIENYSPRVMEQFGLSYETLASAYPSLVVTRMPAFGLDGPWAQRVGFALTMEALAGMAITTGHPEGRPTCPGGVLDPIAGMHAAFATLAALEQRETTGAGQLVEVPMIECALNIAPAPLLEWSANGSVLGRNGNRSARALLQDVYPCAGDDEWVAVTVSTETRCSGTTDSTRQIVTTPCAGSPRHAPVTRSPTRCVLPGSRPASYAVQLLSGGRRRLSRAGSTRFTRIPPSAPSAIRCCRPGSRPGPERCTHDPRRPSASTTARCSATSSASARTSWRSWRGRVSSAPGRPGCDRATTVNHRGERNR
jgi:crotonobetainyl-CoA:carnitine CoA-transferase CaiB-like acyl-CoA transferase